jgi:hypothetical protein
MDENNVEEETSCNACVTWWLMRHYSSWGLVVFLGNSCRMMLGVIFFLFGVNGLSPFLPFSAPMIGPLYLMKFVALMQLLGGVMLLMNLMAPLALMILFPIIINILLYHLLLNQAGLGRALFIFGSSIFLAIIYRNAYSPMLKAKHVICKKGRN